MLRPIIEAENARVLRQRQRLVALHHEYQRAGELSPQDHVWLDALQTEYNVRRLADSSHEVIKILLKRVDIVPVDLALVQAANESGWGTSRFARLGNNLFGQWCFSETCGLIPKNRTEGATHRVATFRTVNESVRKYIRNINTHPAYIEFRRLRSEQRRSGVFPDAHQLARGLINYSERGEDYVLEMRDLLRINKPLLGG